MVLIFSSPPSLPPVKATPWVGVTFEWIGADGSRWDLTSGAEGVAIEPTGTEGLHDPRVTKFASESRAVPGKRNRGWRALARDVFWPVLVYTDQSSSAWNDTYNRFFKSVHPEVEGTWRVGSGGQFRELKLTGKYDESHRSNYDPHVMGWGKYGVTLEAAQPFWTGTAVERGPWSAPDPVDFIDPGGSPPFHISSSSALGSAAIPNPGDVEAYPVWTVTGPLTDVELGVGDRLIEVPFDVADGEVLVIDTDPRNVTATLDGVDVTEDLGFQSFAPVPPAESAALHVEATGSGSVRVSLVPLYFRAY